MSLLEGSWIMLALALAGALGLLWHQHRQAVRFRQDAERTLTVSREAAARQLIELRAAMAEAQAELDRQPALQDEIARLRSKYRRLYANYTKLARHLEGDQPPE